jgi:hypothetical protein
MAAELLLESTGAVVMSGYFSRLAQRTGLQPGMAAPTDAAATAAEIVEEDVQVDAPLAANIAPGASESSTPQASPSRPQFANPRILTATHTAAEEDAPRDDSPALHPPDAAENPSVNAARRRQTAPPSVITGDVPAVGSLQAKEFVEPARDTEPERVETEPPRANATGPGVKPERSRSESAFTGTPHSGRLRQAATTPATLPAPAWEKFDAGPAAERRPPREETTRAPDFKTDPVSPRLLPASNGAPAAHDVAVHIGAIQLEIHPPAAPRPAPARPEVPRERPRFEPRRHYLRF